MEQRSPEFWKWVDQQMLHVIFGRMDLVDLAWWRFYDGKRIAEALWRLLDYKS